MKKPIRNQRARSAAEWSEIVTDLVRSGESPDDFAAKHGVNTGTLKWWRTRLQPVRGRRGRTLAAPRLVPVTVVRPTHDTRAAQSGSWELRNATGDVLRVEGELPIASLREVLGAFTRTGRRR